jgi:lauroyl/myristoyl acyltransferase
MKLLVLLQKLGIVFIRVIPLKLADKIAARIGIFCCYLLKTKRTYIQNNLKHIFADENISVEQFNYYVKNTFINFARVTVDFLRLGYISKKDIISSVRPFGVVEHTTQGLSLKRGVVLITLHLGNWDYAGSYLAALGVPMSALVEETESEMFDLYTKHRERTGMQTFSVGKAGYAFLQTIKNNRVLAVLADRDIMKNGITVDFYSGKRNIPKGLADIVIKRKLPVLFAYMVLNPNKGQHRYLGVIEPPIVFNKTIDEFNRLMVTKFQHYIRSYPDQWLVFHPEWVE